jgi:anti-sigma regulatory factor (Ser/Thr protein kinase)
MNADRQSDKKRRILGRVERGEFVGRAAELQQIVSHPHGLQARGLLLLLEPSAGVSEFLRQAYDALFNQRGKIIPIYFALPRDETTAVSAAIEFLNTFLLQYVAFRRDEPALCQSSVTLNDLLELAPPTDYEWIEQLVESYNRERFGNDDRALIRWCFSAPQKIPTTNGRAFVMLDAVPLAEPTSGGPSLGREMIRVLSRSNLPYAVAGLRRQLLGAVHGIHCDFDAIDIIRLGKLSDDDGRSLVERVAQRQQVRLSEETRDLLVQQFQCSPFFITAFIQAAREHNTSLNNYLACEQLYVDELMGGRINRYYSSLLEEIAFEPETRRALVRMLYESAVAGGRRSSFETWKKRLRLEVDELERVLRTLNVQEFITRDGSSIEAGGGSQVWQDYLKTRFRLEIASDPRALVVAETITELLKRAPHTMARHYRRGAAVGLSELLTGFDCQRVPSSLFDYERFSKAYKGAPPEEIGAGLDAETEMVRLPQVVHVASCASFNPDMQQMCDEERCVVGHAFKDANYTDDSEVIWLAAEIDSKLEADRDLTAAWCERLDLLARQSGFGRIQIWLIATEGFSSAASQLLGDRGAYGSSRQQIELLTARLSEFSALDKEASLTNEFEMTVPMGGDNEMIVAHTVELIARRLNFKPEAINQIKHAVVEAWINASEHSLSPDRKIHQRFRFDADKLVIIISSRGIVPVSVEAQNGEKRSESSDTSASRRGWGLNMIRTLMDEVEFERVDDGTSLRMTKYLRS